MPKSISRILTLLAIAGVLAILAVMLASGRRAGGGQRPAVGHVVPRERYQPVIGTYGGRLVRPSLGPPKSFNPITSGEMSTTEFTTYMYSGLTGMDAWTFQTIPSLAVSWTPDETGLVWTVKLRPGVTWSDGVPFTADDVVFTYQTIYDDRIATSSRDPITGPNGEQWKVQKVDELTVRFTLYDRSALFTELIGEGIIPRHKHEPAVRAGKFNEALGTTSLPEDMPVTGPFMFGSYDGTRVVLKRNPRYWKKDAAGNSLPYLDEMVWVVIQDIDVQSLRFFQGDLDMVLVYGKDFPNFTKPRDRGDFTVYMLGPNFGQSFLLFNQNTGVNPKTGQPYVPPHKLAWFRDVRFRRAVSHAVDRQFMADGILNGLAYPQHGPLTNHPELPMAYPGLPPIEYDPDKARALLAGMGLADRNGDGWLEDAQGNLVEFNLTTNVENEVRAKIAASIRQDLEAMGVRVNFRAMSFNTLITKLDFTYDWEACVMSLTGAPDPHWGSNTWKSSGRMHMWFPGQETPASDWEAEIDDLFARGGREMDVARRKAIYRRWQEIAAEQQPFIYTLNQEAIVAMRNRFGNVFPAPSVFPQPDDGVLHNIEEIYVLSEPPSSGPPAQGQR